VGRTSDGAKGRPRRKKKERRGGSEVRWMLEDFFVKGISESWSVGAGYWRVWAGGIALVLVEEGEIGRS